MIDVLDAVVMRIWFNGACMLTAAMLNKY